MKQARSVGVLMASLEAWSKRTKYAAIYKTFQKHTLAIAKAGLEEMPKLTPQFWAYWWATNHNAYIRGTVTQTELLGLHEIMYQFLSAYARGELINEKSNEEAKTTARIVPKGKGRPEGTDRV